MSNSGASDPGFTTQNGTVSENSSLDEGESIDGKWRPVQRMNIDQSHHGRHMYLQGGRYSMQRVKLYLYK